MSAVSILKKLRKSILISIAVLFLVGSVFLLMWMAKLDKVITQQFEGRRWTLPAQVYAEPLALYAGQNFGADVLEQELLRLGYDSVPVPKEQGNYRRRGTVIDFVSRRFQFPDELQESQVLSVTADAGSLTSIKNQAGEDVAIFRLDPLLIGSIFPIHGEDRVVVAPGEVPKLLSEALKVVEDRKFDTHHGVNLSAIIRAAWVNFRAGQIEQGGSTLTQQLVKSYFLDNRRTFGRKLDEAMMSVLLEFHFDKRDIMNAYVNEIYLGQDGRRAVHGFGLGSQFYFGKPLGELRLHEIALLVAMVRGPSYYDPRRHPKRSLARRDLVLKLMAQFNVITEAEAKDASSFPLGVIRKGVQVGGNYPAFLDLIRRTLRRDYREEDLTEAGLKIFSTLDPIVQQRAESSLSSELKRLDAARKVKRKESLEGVVVVTAPQNGDVIAMVGGRQANFDGFNRALDAKRSIGSLVKPVVFLTAVQSGRFNAASIVQDAPMEIPLANGKVWRPKNFSPEFYGDVPLVRALAQSMNLATVKVGLDVGLDAVSKEFKALGLAQEPPQIPALLLGSLDVSPLEVAQIYNAFANGGFNTPLRAVRDVIDAQGKPLKRFPLDVTQVAEPDAIYQVNRMMLTVMERGTGAGARANLPPGLVVAGKSGTSSDNRDSWFAGFSATHLAVVWVGYDSNSETGLTGSSGSLPVWSRLMSAIGTTSWNTPMPESLEEAWIEYPTGLGVKPGCGEKVIAVAVPLGTQLPMKPECEQGVLGEVGERVTNWFRNLTQ
jgi:penicillin-binding protein 1B